MKVYCKDCEYFEGLYNPFDESTFYKCKSPSNTKTKNTWKEILYSYPISPKKKNKNNDCDWYEEKLLI
jgi:hypothetical protein